MRRLDVEQEHLGTVALLIKHACHCKGIATVVAWSSKYYHALCSAPARHYLKCDSRRRTLHQVELRNSVGSDGLAVNFLKCLVGKYFHLTNTRFLSYFIFNRALIYIKVASFHFEPTKLSKKQIKSTIIGTEKYLF